jgi:opacity protein-like surface antigen
MGGIMGRLREHASRYLGSTIIAVSLASFALGSEAAANSLPSVVKLEEAIAALEARVAALAPLQARVDALEARLHQYEQSGGQGPHDSSPKPLLVSLTEQHIQSAPMMVAPSSMPVALQEENGWSGFYWGTSFGYGSGNAKSKFSNMRQYRDTTTSKGSEREDGITSILSDTFTYSQTDKYSSQSTGSLRNEGALADLYLGANAHLTPRIVAGVQVEGTLSAMPFDSKLSGDKGTRTRSFTTRSTNTQSDGDYFKINSSDKESGHFTNEYNDPVNLELDWMVSVIGRAGWLATPTTFLYGLAGWSYGHFDVEDVPHDFGLGRLQDFNANGPTVGGGLEKKLSPKWSLRAEYRYTDFGKESFSTKSRTTDKDSSSGSDSQSSMERCCEGQTFSRSSSGTDSSKSTSVQNDSSKGYFDNEMHVGRVGVTRYFSWD